MVKKLSKKALGFLPFPFGQIVTVVLKILDHPKTVYRGSVGKRGVRKIRLTRLGVKIAGPLEQVNKKGLLSFRIKKSKKRKHAFKISPFCSFYVKKNKLPKRISYAVAKKQCAMINKGKSKTNRIQMRVKNNRVNQIKFY